MKALLHRKGGTARRLRILAVDDEPGILSFVRRVLEPAGYHVVVADSGLMAIEAMATQGPFDALVTDLLMPNMNGDELARRLRGEWPDLKVLYLTGFSDQLFKAKVTLWDAEAFLEKPTTVQGLQQAVSMLLFGTLTGTAEQPPAPPVPRTA